MKDIFRVDTLESRAGNLARKDIREMLKSSGVSVVFDFDHTIANTSSFHKQSFQVALEGVNRSFDIMPDFIKKELRGKSDEKIIEILLSVSGGVDEDLLSRAISAREKCLEELVLNVIDLSSYLIEGIPELVEYLRNHHKRVGIASASPDGFVSEFIKKSFVGGKSMADVFVPDAIVGGTTVRVIHQALLSSGVSAPSLNKPNPLSIILSASKVGGYKDDNYPILYVGDGKVDALSVRGRYNMTGLVVNARDSDELSGELVGYRNIVVVRSLQEVVNE